MMIFMMYDLYCFRPSDLLHYRGKIGTPYKWAQTISGYNKLDTALSATESAPLKLSSVSTLLNKIRKLVLDRAELVHQISELGLYTYLITIDII